MPDPELQYPDWRRIFVGTQVVSLAVALMLIVMSGELWMNLVYSLVIGNITSLLINGCRLALAKWLPPRLKAQGQPLSSGWIGWRWAAPMVVVCGAAGYQLGMLAANALTGHSKASLLSQGSHGWHAWGGPGIISIFASLIITWFFYSRAKLSAAEKQAAEAAQLAAETQLKLLESQLEPHMLFNTLANLRALIGVDPQRAQQMLDSLIDFLRATLNASRVPLHPLSAEFQRVQDYLALMQIRMGPRLRLHFSLPPELAALPVPPLLLQPLVENAIKHGLEPQRGGGELWLSAEREGQALCLRVADSGVGLQSAGLQSAGSERVSFQSATGEPGAGTAAGAAQSTPGFGTPGFGIEQVRQRLRTLYGECATFTLQAREGGGAQAVIHLPLPTAG